MKQEDQVGWFAIGAIWFLTIMCVSLALVFWLVHT